MGHLLKAAKLELPWPEAAPEADHDHLMILPAILAVTLQLLAQSWCLLNLRILYQCLFKLESDVGASVRTASQDEKHN